MFKQFSRKQQVALLATLIASTCLFTSTPNIARATTDTCWDIDQYLCCTPYNNQIWGNCGATPCPPDYIDNTIASNKKTVPSGWLITELFRSLTDGECTVYPGICNYTVSPPVCAYSTLLFEKTCVRYERPGSFDEMTCF